MDGKNVVIYSSQTGTAEDVAYKIFSLLHKLDSRIEIYSANQVDISSIPSYSLIVFIISTTGDGDMPDSMSSLWKFLLRKSLSSNSLCNTSITVFGLGDSSYAKYNASARKLFARLIQLGAKEFISLELGDDQAKYGYLSALYPWMEKLYKAFGSIYGYEIVEKTNILTSHLSSHQYQIHLVGINDLTTSKTNLLDKTDVLTLYQKNFRRPNLYKPIHRNVASDTNMKTATNQTEYLRHATLIENIRMTAEDWFQDIRHLRFSMNLDSEYDVPYDPGDIAVIYPMNPFPLVNRAIAVMATTVTATTVTATTISSDDLIFNSLITIEYLSTSIRPSRVGTINHPISITDLFTYILDINGIPQRSYFEGLAKYANNEEERDKLIELSSPEGIDLFYDYVIKEKRNYIEILEDFRSCRPPLNILLELIPIIQPRQYSIASYPISSVHSHSHSIELNSSSHSVSIQQMTMDVCVGRIQSKTRYGRLRNGLCSNYLCDLNLESEIYFYIKPGTFQPPNRIETPLILIGPGTGIAPMRAIIQERMYYRKQAQQLNHEFISKSISNPGPNPGPCILFYGCRKRDKDYLYRNEWEVLFDKVVDSSDPDLMVCRIQSFDSNIKSHPLHISIAFSREDRRVLDFNPSRKVYVTDKMLLRGSYLWDLVHNYNAYIFISGSTNKMPQDVRKTFLKVIQEFGHMSVEESEVYLHRLEKCKRYIVEAWT